QREGAVHHAGHARDVYGGVVRRGVGDAHCQRGVGEEPVAEAERGGARRAPLEVAMVVLVRGLVARRRGPVRRMLGGAEHRSGRTSNHVSTLPTPPAAIAWVAWDATTSAATTWPSSWTGSLPIAPRSCGRAFTATVRIPPS